LAYRWFCRLNLEETVPDHSSLTKIRDRMGEDVFKSIFDKILKICFERGLAKGTKVMMDGSIIKADAALRSMVDRPQNGEQLKDLVPPKYIKNRKLGNDHQVSKTDPDCTLAGKTGEPKKLAYKVHNTIDRESRIVLDTHVTTGADVEGKVMMGRIDAYESSFEKQIEEITADRGYGYGENLHELESRGIKHYVPNFHEDVGEKIDPEMFTYDEKFDEFNCKMGHKLTATNAPAVLKQNMQMYRVLGGHCSNCPIKDQCFGHSPKNRGRRIFRNIYWKIQAEVRKRETEDDFKKMRGERQWKMEGNFAEAKENHCLSRARLRGRAKMQIQAYMTGVVLNLKRMVSCTGGTSKTKILFLEIWVEKLSRKMIGQFFCCPI
jgi:IS5 family transposase